MMNVESPVKIFLRNVFLIDFTGRIFFMRYNMIFWLDVEKYAHSIKSVLCTNMHG